MVSNNQVVDQGQGKQHIRGLTFPKGYSFSVIPAQARTGIRKIYPKGQNLRQAFLGYLSLMPFYSHRVSIYGQRRNAHATNDATKMTLICA